MRSQIDTVFIKNSVFLFKVFITFCISQRSGSSFCILLLRRFASN